MVKEISIVSGDPFTKEGGASFTCFVLPFCFNPDSLSIYDAKDIHCADMPRYTPIDMCSQEWVKRKRYFTGETAKVLYEHAKWFELSEYYWDKFLYPKIFYFRIESQQKITVRLHPPRLVLLEWHDSKLPYSQKKADLFHTGFLIVEASFLENENTPSIGYGDLLYFNDLFRYWRVPFEKHEAKMRISLGDVFGDKLEDDKVLEEIYFQRWAKLLEIPFQFSADKRLFRLFPAQWGRDAKCWWASEAYKQLPITQNNTQRKDSGWICYVDDRCFVWSCAVVEQGAHALTLMGNKDAESITRLGGWIKLLNVDGPGWNISEINQATCFEKAWAEDRSYVRWQHYNVLYGFNYHAGVMLTGPCNEPPISRHFHDQYLDMTLLLLYLRVTIFRFSNKLTRLSTDMRNNTDSFRKHREEFKTLRREFSVFTNLYQFPLISNQQQAIEMYELIRKRMDVEELFKEVEEEIKSSHEYFQFEEESILNNKIFWLTIVGTVIALLSIPNAIELFT